MNVTVLLILFLANQYNFGTPDPNTYQQRDSLSKILNKCYIYEGLEYDSTFINRDTSYLQRRLSTEIENLSGEVYRMIDTNVNIKKWEIIYQICEQYELKNNFEKQIEEERLYSKKYGTINLSKIDSRKQRIIRCDHEIKELKKEFQILTNTPFNNIYCKNSLEDLDARTEITKDSLAKSIIDSLLYK